VEKIIDFKGERATQLIVDLQTDYLDLCEKYKDRCDVQAFVFCVIKSVATMTLLYAPSHKEAMALLMLAIDQAIGLEEEK